MSYEKANQNYRLKCNRSQPCENCIKRGDAMSCSYAAPGTRKKQASSSSSGSSPDGMQNRIDRLEGLVLSLMTNGSQSAGPAAATRALSMSESTGSSGYPQDGDVDIENRQNGMSRGEGDEGESETDQVAQSIGLMRVDNNKSMYIADSHWATILSDVSNSITLRCREANFLRSPRSRTTSPSIKSSTRNRCKRWKRPRNEKAQCPTGRPFYTADNNP